MFLMKSARRKRFRGESSSIATMRDGLITFKGKHSSAAVPVNLGLVFLRGPFGIGEPHLASPPAGTD